MEEEITERKINNGLRADFDYVVKHKFNMNKYHERERNEGTGSNSGCV